MKTKKTCPACNLEKSGLQWNKNRRSADGLSSYCKGCSARRKKESRASKEGYYRTEVASTNESIKSRVLVHYAEGIPRCGRCGYGDDRALTVDLALAKSHKNSGVLLWKWIIRSGFPEGFEIICMNCRAIKRHDEKHPQHLQTNCRLTARPS